MDLIPLACSRARNTKSQLSGGGPRAVAAPSLSGATAHRNPKKAGVSDLTEDRRPMNPTPISTDPSLYDPPPLQPLACKQCHARSNANGISLASCLRCHRVYYCSSNQGHQKVCGGKFEVDLAHGEQPSAVKLAWGEPSVVSKLQVSPPAQVSAVPLDSDEAATVQPAQCAVCAHPLDRQEPGKAVRGDCGHELHKECAEMLASLGVPQACCESPRGEASNPSHLMGATQRYFVIQRSVAKARKSWDDLTAAEHQALKGVRQQWRLEAASGTMYNQHQAMYNLGVVFSAGHGVPSSDTEAVRWWRKAADSGFVWAQLKMGDAYAFGRGVERNLAKAAASWRSAADQGNPTAQFNLGLFYLNECGSRQLKADADRSARRWLTRAGTRGHGEAQYLVARLFDRGLCGARACHAESAVWLKRAADAGHAEAQAELGVKHRDGLGVDQSFDAAVRWFSRSAAQGNARAQCFLAASLAAGLGAPLDDAAAARWFHKAAAQGDAEAQHRLGSMTLSGRGGLRADAREALRLTEAAAAQGLAQAVFSLALFHEHGLYDRCDGPEYAHGGEAAGDAVGKARLFLERSVTRAVELYDRAAEQGHAGAQEALRRLRADDAAAKGKPYPSLQQHCSPSQSSNPLRRQGPGRDPRADSAAFLPGARVVLRGLVKQPALNGTRGVIASFVEARGRFKIKLDNEKGGILMLARNLREMRFEV